MSTDYYDGMEIMHVTSTSDMCAAGEHGQCPANAPANEDQTCRICTCTCHASRTGDCARGHHNPGGQRLHGGCRGWILRTCSSTVLLVRDGTSTVDPAHGHDPVPCSCDCHDGGRPSLDEALAARDRGLVEQQHHQRLMLR